MMDVIWLVSLLTMQSLPLCLLLWLILFTVCYFTESTGEETATATTVAEQSTAEDDHKKPEETTDDNK